MISNTTLTSKCCQPFTFPHGRSPHYTFVYTFTRRVLCQISTATKLTPTLYHIGSQDWYQNVKLSTETGDSERGYPDREATVGKFSPSPTSHSSQSRLLDCIIFPGRHPLLHSGPCTGNILQPHHGAMALMPSLILLEFSSFPSVVFGRLQISFRAILPDIPKDGIVT